MSELNTDLILQAGNIGKGFGAQFQAGRDKATANLVQLMTLRDLVRAQAASARLADLAPTFVGKDGSPNYGAISQYQASTGDVRGLLGTERSRAQTASAKAQETLNMAKIPVEQLKAANAIMGSTMQLFGHRDTPEEWAEGVALAMKDPQLSLMVTSGRIPTQFPGAKGMRELMMQGMSIKERMADEIARQRLAQDQSQFQQAQGAIQNRFDTSQAAAESRFQRRPPSQEFTTGYDEQGRPIVSMGGGKPLTEGQAKSATNVSGAAVANRELANLGAEGFDPTSLAGGINTAMADVPMLNMLASEGGQRQNAANQGFSQAVNYQRSGSASTEAEYNRGVSSMIDRIGDKPAVTAYKAQMRDALLQAVAAGGGPRVDAIMQQVLAGSAPSLPTQGSVQNRTAAPSMPVISSDSDYDQLPSGTRFTDPQGQVRVKP